MELGDLKKINLCYCCVQDRLVKEIQTKLLWGEKLKTVNSQSATLPL
jgi:hypothetical protein